MVKLNYLLTQFQLDLWSLLQGIWEYTCRLVQKYTQRVEKVFGLSQKVSQCAKVGHIQDLFLAPIWFFLSHVSRQQHECR